MGPTSDQPTLLFAFHYHMSPPRRPTAAEVVSPLRQYPRASKLLSAAEADRGGLHALRHGGASAATLGGATEQQTRALGRWHGDSVAIYVSTTKAMQGLAASVAISTALTGPPVPLLHSLFARATPAPGVRSLQS